MTEQGKIDMRKLVSIVVGCLAIIGYIAGSVTMINKIDNKAEYSIDKVQTVRADVDLLDRDISNVCDAVNSNTTAIKLHEQRLTTIAETNREFKQSMDNFTRSASEWAQTASVLTEQIKQLRKEIKELKEK